MDASAWCEALERTNGCKAAMNDIRTSIKYEIHNKLLQDDALHQELIDSQYEVLFKRGFHVYGYRRGFLNVESNDIRIEQLCDLFQNPSSGEAINALVHIRFQPSTSLDGILFHQIRPDVPKDDCDYLRVGESGMWINRPGRETDKYDALVARIYRTDETVELTLVRYWELGDFPIGNGRNGVPTPNQTCYVWHDQYKHAENSAAVNRLTLQQLVAVVR